VGREGFSRLGERAARVVRDYPPPEGLCRRIRWHFSHFPATREGVEQLGCHAPSDSLATMLPRDEEFAHVECRRCVAQAFHQGKSRRAAIDSNQKWKSAPGARP